MELRAVAKGRVQGVGFRAATRRFALALNLTGFVRNLQDGSVEIVAHGEKPALEALVHKLQEAFAPCSIDFSLRSHESKDHYNDFCIT